MLKDVKDQKDVKEQIKEIVLSYDIDAEKAVEMAEKLHDEVYYRPFGGAKSFAELEEMMKVEEFSAKVQRETYFLETLIGNIVSDEEGSTDTKADAIKSAADEYRQRVNNLDVDSKSNKGWFSTVKEYLFGSDPVAKPVHGSELPTAGGFKVYLDAQGEYRWLSLSSNAFEDLDKELFTTKALEEAIEYAEKSGERGPLLLYHIPSAEVGHCDFQAMAGRFLVESGTFDDTPMGAKALEYFIKASEEHQVSIGYQYHDGDEEDGQYDWLRIYERSVTPYGAAANPWTSFKVIGENNMEARHIEMLEKVLGKELTSEVIATAEEKTKDLEQQVRFKEKTPDATNESLMHIKALIEALPEGEDVRIKLEKDFDVLAKALQPEEENEDAKEKAKETEGESSSSEGTTTEAVSSTEEVGLPSSGQLREFATLITDIADGLESVKSAVASLESEVKELKASDDEKISSIMAPRARLFGDRPSTSEDNVLDEGKIKELVGSSFAGEYEDPAKKYVDDLLKGRNGA
jgi:uncharacterized protein YegP (UPF0339 family)